MMNPQNLTQTHHCPVCDGRDLTLLVEIPQVPIHCNLLWPNRAAAIQAPRGEIQLEFCQSCGHIFNPAFNPALMAYTQAYENSLHFSPRFQKYAETLAAYLIERYDLRHKTIIEIGCGQGDFLTLLCRLGKNRGFGFDPSFDQSLDQNGHPEQNREMMPEEITFIQDFYSDRYAGYEADLICCRHVLEHIQSPSQFLRDVRRSIGDCQQTVVFFEVPNVSFTVRDGGIWDLIYEHCSYFSANSLAYLFRSCGFDICDLTAAYEGQFLCIEAWPGEKIASNGRPSGDALGEMASDVAAFAGNYRHKVLIWRHNLDRMAQAEQRVVVWGSGSKGVTFLNTLQTQDQIKYVVDINPRKHGMYMAGTGQQIVSPEFLRDYQPDKVIVMNSIYLDEIRELVTNFGLAPKFLCV